MFSENLNVPNTLPSAARNAFTVKVGGDDKAIDFIAWTLSSDILDVDFSDPIYQGQTVVVSYDKTAAGDDAIADAADNEVASFTTGVDGVPAVVNNSTQVNPNSAPEFSVELAVFTLPENSAADTVVGTVTATDDDDDTLTYSLEGTDAASFAIDSGTGEIKTKSGVTYDYETKFIYEMTAKADDGNGGTATVDVRIVLLDDQTEPTPVVVTLRLSDADGEVSEDAGAVRVRAAVSPASATAFTVTVSASPVAPATDDDFELSSNRVLSFAANATESTGTVTIRVVDDDEREPDDVVRVSGAVSNAAIPDPDDVTLTILDDDTPPPPVIERSGVLSTPRLRSRGASEPDTYGEGETIRIAVEFDQTVHVEGEPTMELEVGDPCESVCEARYESGSGTDTLVFAYLVLEVDRDRNGIAIRNNPIKVVYGDSIRNDAGEEARLSLSGGRASGHKVDGSRTAEPYLSVENAEAHEADGEMDFTVRLEPHGLGIVTVEYRTRDGSARAGSDYTETRGTLRFNSLETERTVTVPIIDDTNEDDGETFTLRLSNPRGAKLGDREARGRIRNSDPLTAAFPASAFASSSHSGAADRPQAVVAFSEAVAAFAADTPSVSVTGGAVASVQPHAEDGLANAWVFFLVPDGDGDVTFALVAEAACAAGGICTAGGRTLMVVPAAATIPGSGGSGGGAADGVVRGRAGGA